jgi:hypothetical protein
VGGGCGGGIFTFLPHLEFRVELFVADAGQPVLLIPRLIDLIIGVGGVLGRHVLLAGVPVYIVIIVINNTYMNRERGRERVGDEEEEQLRGELGTETLEQPTLKIRGLRRTELSRRGKSIRKKRERRKGEGGRNSGGVRGRHSLVALELIRRLHRPRERCHRGHEPQGC